METLSRDLLARVMGHGRACTHDRPLYRAVSRQFGGAVALSAPAPCGHALATTCAAARGHLSRLQWARAQGCPWNTKTCSEASRGGHLALLQWARAEGCPWDWRTCSAAARGGHLALLQWARAEGCPWDWRTCSAAARGGHLGVLQWARAQGCPWDEYTCCLLYTSPSPRD